MKSNAPYLMFKIRALRWR